MGSTWAAVVKSRVVDWSGHWQYSPQFHKVGPAILKASDIGLKTETIWASNDELTSMKLKDGLFFFRFLLLRFGTK
jgi:hypothetical protein